MINKKYIPLIIALSIPVLMIILVAAFIYLPGIGQKPKSNFLYLTGNNGYYYGQQEYQVSGGHLVYSATNQIKSENLNPKVPTVEPHFYVYDVVKNTATEITFQQAQTYKLDSSNLSSDGYTVTRGSYGGGGFLFDSAPGDYNSWFIKGHNRSFKLNLKISGTDYYNFQFLGWVQ